MCGMWSSLFREEVQKAFPGKKRLSRFSEKKKSSKKKRGEIMEKEVNKFEFENGVKECLNQIDKEGKDGKLELTNAQWNEVYDKIYDKFTKGFLIISDKTKQCIVKFCSDITVCYGKEAGKEALKIILSEFIFNILDSGNKQAYLNIKNDLLKELEELELDNNYLEGVVSNTKEEVKQDARKKSKRKL